MRINSPLIMKKQYYTLIIFSTISLLIFQSCKENLSKKDYLRKVLSEIEQIESVTYFSTVSGSAPGDTQVEFFGKPVYNKNQYGTGREVSRFDIWISKSNNLPYRYRRNMSHSTSWETCTNVKFNNTGIEELIKRSLT